MKTKGLCSRYAVVRGDSLEPIDGALYFRQDKAEARRQKTYDPPNFLVREVVIMPADLARDMVDCYLAHGKKPR